MSTPYGEILRPRFTLSSLSKSGLFVCTITRFYSQKLNWEGLSTITLTVLSDLYQFLFLSILFHYLFLFYLWFRFSAVNEADYLSFRAHCKYFVTSSLDHIAQLQPPAAASTRSSSLVSICSRPLNVLLIHHVANSFKSICFTSSPYHWNQVRDPVFLD